MQSPTRTPSDRPYLAAPGRAAWRPVAAAFAILATLSACAPRAQPTAHDFKVLRTYGWDTTVPDPQAEWNPVSSEVLVRSLGGFAVLDQGGGKQQYFTSKEKREMSHAAWLNANQFVFGSDVNVTRTEDGHVIPPGGGMVVITVANGAIAKSEVLAKSGYRPRPWGDQVVAQDGDDVVLVDRKGRGTPFTKGFFAEPQIGGAGLCWQVTPVLEKDYWTGLPRLGRLVVRWKSGKISEVPAAIEARWTAAGGVVATQLAKEPPATGPWWLAGTAIISLADAQAKPVVIAEGVHSPAPHPTMPVIAATTNDGRLVLIDLAGGPAHEIAPIGERARWSADGMRLLAEEPVEGKPLAHYVRVYIFKIGEAAAAPAP